MWNIFRQQRANAALGSQNQEETHNNVREKEMELWLILLMIANTWELL